MSQSHSERLDDGAKARINDLIKGFLALDFYDGLHETRVQKLVFYTEVYVVAHYRMRATEASFRPYKYGAYSKDVRIQLENLTDVDRKRIIRHGERTVEYSTESHSYEHEVFSNLVEKVHQATKFKSTSELAQFSKDGWLFENTEYNQPMHFDEFASALDDHPNLEQELKSQLPEKVDLSEAEKSSLVALDTES